MHQRNRHCTFCGQAFDAASPWPRTCAACHETTYLNPIPVAVLVLPVDDGVLAVRRAIAPGSGKLALPGGYIDAAETWQEACVRELREETGIVVAPGGVSALRVVTVEEGRRLLVFGVAQPLRSADLPAFAPTHETSERVVLRRPEELAFAAHGDVVRAYFARRDDRLQG